MLQFCQFQSLVFVINIYLVTKTLWLKHKPIFAHIRSKLKNYQVWTDLKPSASRPHRLLNYKRKLKHVQSEMKSNVSEATKAIFSFMPLSKNGITIFVLAKVDQNHVNIIFHHAFGDFLIQIITRWSLRNPDYTQFWNNCNNPIVATKICVTALFLSLFCRLFTIIHMKQPCFYGI
jgi:hypothetical protein